MNPLHILWHVMHRDDDVFAELAQLHEAITDDAADPPLRREVQAGRSTTLKTPYSHTHIV